MGDIGHDFKRLAHPLAQIEAAELFWSHALAFVNDEWSDLYTDLPPDEEELAEYLEPSELLPVLAGLNLRFELTSSGTERAEMLEGFWTAPYANTTQSILFHYWLLKLKQQLSGIDARVIDAGIMWTDLVLVPDPDGVARAAHYLVREALGVHHEVERHVRSEEERERTLYRSTRTPVPKSLLGSGPRSDKPVLADKVALVLRDAMKPLSAVDVAKILRARNVASINTTLHQICTKRKPKRLAGWVRQLDDGRYSWNAPQTGADEDRT